MLQKVRTMESTKCPDCNQCQKCSENRCRLCRKGSHGTAPSELGGGFTHGQYMEWKRRKEKRCAVTIFSGSSKEEL